jgi:hypothetical protein
MDTQTQQVTKTFSVDAPVVEAASPQKEYETKKVLFRSYQIIWFILGVIEVLLAFRIVLKFLGASTASGFTSFIYALSNPLALPFAGIFNVTQVSNSVFEWSTLIAMLVYAIFAYGIIALFQLGKPTNQNEVESVVNNQ